MKRFALVAALMLLCGSSALAQPQEVTADDGTISLRFGQTKTFRFDKSVSKVVVSGQNIVDVKPQPQSDRVLDFTGTGYGRALVTIVGEDGKEMDRLNLDVIGSVVKVYGQKPPITGIGRPGMEYDAFVCSDVGCGRVNPDIETGPSAAIISDTKTGADGSAHTVTKEYR